MKRFGAVGLAMLLAASGSAASVPSAPADAKPAETKAVEAPKK